MKSGTTDFPRRQMVVNGTTQLNRELDWSVGRELERKDAEIARLRAQLNIAVTALRRINSLGDKNVLKYAQQIAREGVAFEQSPAKSED